VFEVAHLTKRFGTVNAVNDLSFAAQPGRVTGFLGPNGSGKTTTFRAALDLVKPNAGQVTFDGRPYTKIPHPARQIGVMLEASSFHPGRTALNQLMTMAPGVGVDQARCLEVLTLVGLAGQERKRVGKFSTGMRGRLALAGALLGNPSTLLLDEPTNGLDPEGIAWVRSLLRSLAGQGRTVVVSSHLLAEVEQCVDDVVIITGGRLVHASSLEQMRQMAVPRTQVLAADPAALGQLISGQGWRAFAGPEGSAIVEGAPAWEIGRAAYQSGLELHRLSPLQEGLEQLYFSMTGGGYR
jgi:ABC-2 type transport system ATP-binding protein